MTQSATEMLARIRAFDWEARTSLGPMEQWPQSLKTSVSLILNAQMPMWLGWGPEMVFFYNDAYVQVLSQAKHPWALGRPAREVWSEIWNICGPLAERVFRDRQAPFVEDVRLFMDRGGGFLEEVYYSFSYSPIEIEDGSVGGLFCPNTEVTAKILNARRLRTLSELAAKALVQRTLVAATATAAATLAKNPDDIPFALIYLAESGQEVRLAEAVSIAPDSLPSTWAVDQVLANREPVVVEVPASAGAPLGLADQAIRTAIALPISASGQEQPLGVLVAGINPTRRLDADYTTFFELVATQVGTAMQAALVAEEEKRRADALAELDRVKTAFFSNISHEFRTPLTLMIGPTEDALASGDKVLRGASLETVYRNELRLLKLVNALLDFSRIEAGRMQASLEPVDLTIFTADVASTFRSAIEKAGLRFEVVTSPLPHEVLVDREMWEKIVLNLLSNALKFTPAGTIRLTLEHTADQIVLAVEDTGTGIPEHEIPRLFERFHRVENPAARTQEGSGIGLALVQELAKLHGGSISATSTLGRGSRFVVELPLRRPRDVDRARTSSQTGIARAAFRAEAQRLSPVEGYPAVPEGPHILLADDNADMRDYVRRLLSEHWQVVAVADGETALASARAQRPELILTDVMMPGLDGFGLLREIRGDRELQDVPVLLLSARAGDEARVDGFTAGADDYLVKPFSARELVARVRTHLALSSARKAALAASRAKDEFLAMLGHELRNPLAPIMTALELLKVRGTGLTKEHSIIERQVNHLNRLVDDLLDISRITRGQIELKRERIPIRDTINKAVEMASPLIEQKRHHVSIDVASGLVVDADLTRLAQVFCNLLTNAARYTPENGHIRITATAEGDRIHARVTDTGIGISPTMITKIFDLFEQGTNRDASRGEGGLGIGLALVKSLVKLHGGEVSATSEGAGHGSTFEVVLPLVSTTTSETSVKPELAAHSRSKESGRRILLVDDNTDAAFLLSEMLQAMGHQVEVAHDAAAALKIADHYRPDTAILDIGLPVMDGYELGRCLRESGFGPRLMIALTGYGQAQDRVRSKQAGFDEHLVKPINLARLLGVLDGE